LDFDFSLSASSSFRHFDTLAQPRVAGADLVKKSVCALVIASRAIVVSFT
jgi:hypothetical protein